MNERIRELVRESHLDVYGLGKDRYKWESTVDKFAELIVRECADYITEYYDSRDEAYYMKKHFGVEE